MKTKDNKASVASWIEPADGFRHYLGKWLVLSGLLGVLTGSAVVVLDEIVRILLLGNGFGTETFTGVVTAIYNASPISSFLLPFLGLTITGILLYRFAANPLLSGTDEVLRHYHSDRTPLGAKEGLVKYVGAIFTIGFGGSTGLEGPSINVGGVIGSEIWRRLRARFDLSQGDLRILLIAGASAGVSAIFRAPLTGIIFGLEVPYKDDTARRAFFPALIAGTMAYAAFAVFEGTAPLFSFNVTSQIGVFDFFLSAILGLIIGALAMGFTRLLAFVRDFEITVKLPHGTRFVVAGAALGGIALLVRLTIHQPYSFGPGYDLIEESLLGQYSIQLLVSLLMIRIVATALTIGSGGVGGAFFPLSLFGALTGSCFASVLHQSPSLWASVGMSAFISAGYKTPIASVAFVLETTANATYLVPAIISSLVAYSISGRASVSTEQVLVEEVHVSEILGATVSNALDRPPLVLRDNPSVAEVIRKCSATGKSKMVIATKEAMPRIVSLQDAIRVPQEQRDSTSALSLDSRPALVFGETDPLEFAVRQMTNHKDNLAAVVPELDPGRIIGTISMESIFEYIELKREPAKDDS